MAASSVLGELAVLVAVEVVEERVGAADRLPSEL